MDISWQIWEVVRLSVHTDRTAVIFCCGSKRLRLAVFMIYILSCVVHKLFVMGLILAVHQHLNLALLGTDHHRLVAHAPHHVKRIHRTPTQGQLQRVLLDPPLKGFLELVLDLEEAVGRT
jgi:hypothetical protein